MKKLVKGVFSFQQTGVKVYPPKSEQGKSSYWRITWREEGIQRGTTAKDQSAALIKAGDIDLRLSHEGGQRSLLMGAEMIAAYLDPEQRLRVGTHWGPGHANDQKWILNKYLLPEIRKTASGRITNRQLRSAIRSTKTRSTADHLATAISGLMRWGVADGWILSSQDVMTAGFANDVKNKANTGKQRIKQQGGNSEYIDPNEIPDHASVHLLAKMAAVVSKVWWMELFFLLAAYSGLRLGEIIDLDVTDIDLSKRLIRVDYQMQDVGGKQLRALPKREKQRSTVYPEFTPCGYELEKMLRRRLEEVMKLGQEKDGRILLFPALRGGWITHGNFGLMRRKAQKLAGWPKVGNKYRWDFRSLRHVFCSYYLFELGKDARDVSVAAGHENVATTLRMYAGPTAGALDRLTAE